MSFDAIPSLLTRIAVALELIAKNGGTLTAISAELGAPETLTATPAATPAAAAAAADTKPKGKAKKEEAAPTPAATPAAADPAPAADTGGAKWEDVVAQIQILNKITDVNPATQQPKGREGVIALLQHFGLDPLRAEKPHRVPDLKAVNKYDEMLKFVKAQIEAATAPAAAADPDDIDLGI